MFVAGGGTICATLKWDSWPTTNQDFDLWLVHFPPTGPGTIVAASENRQTGTLPPTEGLCFSNTGPTNDAFYLAIRNFSATLAPRFDLFVFGDVGPIRFQTAAGSILEPASSPSALAVGAICWQNSALEPYSSQGPTIDGRVKPDLVGPDSTSSATFGAFAGCGASGFSGTSASSPHVAGAAALAIQANPSFGPAQIQAFLQARAIDLGRPGAQTIYLALGNCSSERRLHIRRHPTSVSILGTNGFTTSATTLTLQWSAVAAAARYEYAIGSSPGGSDIRPFTNVGNVTSFTASGLQLTDGNTYFAAVRAVDGIGLLSTPTVSTGSTIDTYATRREHDYAQPTVPGGGVLLSATATDAHGVASLQFQLSIDGDQTWANVGRPVTATPYQVTTAPLGDGTYGARALATDVPGNSARRRRVVFFIDSLPPVIAMTGPAQGANVKTPLLTANASDTGSGVASVQFQLSHDSGTTWASVGPPITDLPIPVSNHQRRRAGWSDSGTRRGNGSRRAPDYLQSTSRLPG